MHNMSPSDSESYPPLFCQASTPTHGFDLDESPDRVLDFDPLPIIDLHCINQENLSEVCRDWGIFRLVNHGIPLTLFNHLHDHATKLFNLGFESKCALFTNPISYFWGTPALSKAGVPLQRGPQTSNWVEGLNVPLSQLDWVQAEDPLLDFFRLLVEEYGKQQWRVAKIIFEAMGENLKLGPQKSESYLSQSTGLLRVYRYPRCSSSMQAWGMEVHTDSSVLSVLGHDQVGGLQIYKDDVWLDVQPIPNTLVINLGDMMQAISDDVYKSVKHRVKLNKDKERISVGYFVFPTEDTLIQSPGYKPFSYADFRAQVQEDLKTVGFKVGLQNFKLTHSYGTTT